MILENSVYEVLWSVNDELLGESRQDNTKTLFNSCSILSIISIFSDLILFYR